MSTLPAPLSRTDIASAYREVYGIHRFGQPEEEFARRIERAAVEALLAAQTPAELVAQQDHECRFAHWWPRNRALLTGIKQAARAAWHAAVASPRAEPVAQGIPGVAGVAPHTLDECRRMLVAAGWSGGPDGALADALALAAHRAAQPVSVLRMASVLQEIEYAVVHGWPSESLARLESACKAARANSAAADAQAGPVALTEEQIDALLDSPAPFDFVLALHLDGKRGLMHRFARAVIAEFCRINGINGVGATVEKGGASC